MEKPPIPINETARLDALCALEVLDTPPEERFDRITRLARRMFDVPIALVSLVDSDRQWFKSRQGLSACETSREDSFCGHTILGEDAMIVADAHADPRFADNPLVTGAPNLRFYAGQPLIVGAGHKIGTLCLIDTAPREMNAENLSLLRDLAEMVEQQFAALEQTTVDTLTGISNRRGFGVLADKALAACQRAQQEVSLLTFDLNHFKDINDRCGTPLGDQALRDFAECLVHTFRDCDVVARVGGDEFQVLLSGTRAGQAQLLLDRFQDDVSNFNHARQRPYRLSFSVGYARCPAAKLASIEQLSEQADSAMHDQKNRGGTALSA